MEHHRLYELQIEALNESVKRLEKENQKITEELLETRDEVFDWKQKYKDLKKNSYWGIWNLLLKYGLKKRELHFCNSLLTY